MNNQAIGIAIGAFSKAIERIDCVIETTAWELAAEATRRATSDTARDISTNATWNVVSLDTGDCTDEATDDAIIHAVVAAGLTRMSTIQ